MALERILTSCSVLLLACGVCGCSNEDANAAGASGAGGIAAGGSAGSSGSGGARASEMAQWPMPNSPGLGLPNAQSYDSTTIAGVVRDGVTGLSWLQDPGIQLYARADALTLCDQLSFGGFDDWRAPAFIELVSLFSVVPNDRDPNTPIYISTTFKAEGRFWSSSAVSSTGLGRLLDFTADGCSATMACSIGVAAKADEALGGAFCVRGSAPLTTSARYAIEGDKVSDRRTGLTWVSVPAPVQTGAYTDAVSACQALGDGARLPSITELLSLLVPVLDSKTFPNWPADAFTWSSSPVPARPGSYWVAAIAGATRADDAASHNRVECVR